MSRKGRNRGIYCGHEKLYPLSPDVPGRSDSRRKRVLWNGSGGAGRQSRTSYVGRTLHFWKKGFWSYIFFRLYAEMCVLSESGDRGRKVWKRDFFPEADGDFSGIAGEWSGKYQSGYGGTFCRSGEGSTFEGKGAGTCDSGNLQFGRV